MKIPVSNDLKTLSDVEAQQAEIKNLMAEHSDPQTIAASYERLRQPCRQEAGIYGDIRAREESPLKIIG